MKNNQPKPKTDEQLLREFFKEYQALCEKHQAQIVVTPAFKARDDGSWSVVLQSSVGKLPKATDGK